MEVFYCGKYQLLLFLIVELLLLAKANCFAKKSTSFLTLGSCSRPNNPKREQSPSLQKKIDSLTRFVGSIGPVEQRQQQRQERYAIQQIVPNHDRESHHITINYKYNIDNNDQHDDIFHLTDTQIRSLPSDQRFKYRLRQLKMHYKNHGTFSVTKKQNNGLANWVYRQRYEYRQHISHGGDPYYTLLTPERIYALDQIGFDWRMNGSDTSWLRMYHRLEQYHKEHGHIFVSSHEDKALYKFLANQRQYYSNRQRQERQQQIGDRQIISSSQTISQERIEKLEKLDMVWNLKSAKQTKYDIQWNEKLQQVVDIQQNQRRCDNEEINGVGGAGIAESYSKMMFPLPPEYHSLNVWLNQQRIKYKERQLYNVSSLTLEREEALREIGFDFEDENDVCCGPHQQIQPLRQQYRFGSLSWLKKYEELQSYFQENNHTLVNTYTPLGKWVKLQRNEYKKYVVLQRQQQANETSVSSISPPPRTNRTTAQVQKQTTITTTMTLEKIHALEELNFCWDVHEMKWMEKYEKLRLYYQQYNHTRIPKNFEDDPTLPHWVFKQRQIYKQSMIKTENASTVNTKKQQLSPKRIELLNDIHFFENHNYKENVYNTRKKKDASWMKRFEELEEFHRTYGHCCVPKKTHPQLAIWVLNNRREYKLYKENQPSQITPDRAKTLERLIGFDSNLTARDVKWNTNFEKVKKFVTEHGHSCVPLQYSKQPELGRWVNYQRVQYKKWKQQKDKDKPPPSLTLERIQKLDSIGFQWEVGRGVRFKNN